MMFTFSFKFKWQKCMSMIIKLNIHTQRKMKYNYFTSENVVVYRRLIEEFQNNQFSFETLLQYNILLKTPVNILQDNCALCKESKINFMSPNYTARLLSLPPLRLQHNISILQECGSVDLNDYNVVRLNCLMKLKINSFKEVLNIPKEVKIVKEIYEKVFSKSYKSSIFSKLNEDMTVFELRSLLLPHYVYWKFGIDSNIFKEDSKLWNLLLLRSWHLVNKKVDYLRNNIGYTSKITDYEYAVQCDINNVRRICYEIKNIGQITIQEVLRTCPKITLQPVNNIKQFLTWFHKNQLYESLITNCLEVLTLNPIEAINKLEKILKNPTLMLFRNHPRFLHLLYVNHDLEKRIAHLKSNNMSIKWKDIIAPTYKPNKIQKNNKTDAINRTKFLDNEFLNQGPALIAELKKNPNWSRIDLGQMFSSLQYLRGHFTAGAICSNIHIILYQRSKIEKTVSYIRNKYRNYRNHQFTPSQQLAMCLYYMEIEFHFSGDGALASLDTVDKAVNNKS
ncbi:transcription termination factor 5, mitochondrial isoform X2 [Leptopilina boulardi]|uniref:transcription termination factor 5, mitochondrial isoform X2 n=1 Tax=Leptopilina boulardi TaxID=63433 RepID=UPI0021F598FA|nr:transcription termination factor 5, mitochondrial isoform X2 [Leptopilina boulardi]